MTDAQQRDEYEKRAKYVASKKEDYLQGRLSHDDLVEILLLGEPSEYALFQFRYQEALKKDHSAISATLAPLCSKTRCGIVLSSDRFSPIVRMTSLIGAAFPDGTQAPAFAFEMPWTPRPKYVKPDWMKDDDSRPASDFAGARRRSVVAKRRRNCACEAQLHAVRDCCAGKARRLSRGTCPASSAPSH